ncbi:MAG TPA: metallophosphoesterase family protein [Thermomicrobiales bacterium]|nr:metallophosphoesterase family protein [Thermomicrobiales bacterium]HRA30692.1 metallophosphoesterase family protein [Thermomicrobiales bacterium]
MSFGKRVGVLSDIHGATRVLGLALDVCAREEVETIVLLGDLFDRAEQADATIDLLKSWQVIGVYGNHEREVALAAAAGEVDLKPETIALLTALEEEVRIGDIRLTHEVQRWGSVDPVARMFGGHHQDHGDDPAARLTFTGHTHFRQARDERGLLDIGRGVVSIVRERRYLFNPGALQIGQFAIWDREERTVRFRHIEW